MVQVLYVYENINGFKPVYKIYQNYHTASFVTEIIIMVCTYHIKFDIRTWLVLKSQLFMMVHVIERLIPLTSKITEKVKGSKIIIIGEA